MMKAIRVSEPGGPEVLRLQEVPTPAPGPGQVLLRAQAIGVNPVETYIRSGKYPQLPAFPYTPGGDAAGVIEAIGKGVTQIQVGDRVYTAGTITGAYAEFALCLERQVHPLPQRISFEEGAAVNIPYATAYRALFQRARALPGETVLIHGASGGVGVAATQFAVAAGAIVIGTAGTEEGLDVVRGQGAHHAVNHKSPGYVDEIVKLANGTGPDVILEMLANVNLDHDLTVAAPRARIVVIGNRGRVEIDARKIMTKDLSVFGLALWGIPPDEVRRGHLAIIAGLESGALTPVVGTELPLNDAARAHENVMAPGARGKIVLIP